MMAEQDTLFPLEFSISETPKSLGASASSKGRWKAAVRRQARLRIEETDELGFIDRRPLAATIFYFSPDRMKGDVDNIVKPILDALIGVVYLDARQIERVLVQKVEPLFLVQFFKPSDRLTAAVDAAPPVVYIRIDDDLHWRNPR